MSHAAFPYAIGAGGQTALADHRAYVDSLIVQILFVEPGERVNRPDFGCTLRSLVFAGARSEMVTAVEAMAESALRQWAGHAIRVQEVDVTIVDETVQVTVRYVDIATRSAHQLVVAR